MKKNEREEKNNLLLRNGTFKAFISCESLILGE